MSVSTRRIETKRGTNVRIFEAGSGAALVFMHGAGGLFPQNLFLDRLAERYHVYAPEFPAYGESTGEELLEDMQDFALHGWDVIGALGLSKPHLLGHSMGGMIAAEMACLAPNDLSKLVLVGAAGLWIDEHPIPDIFSFLPHEFAQYLFHDRTQGEAMLTGGLDLKNPEALKEFYIGNSKRLSMAGKILFPIPNRRLSKRLYRLTAPTLVIWGKSDKLIPPVYAERFKALIPQAEVVQIAEAGHMVPYEQPEAFVSAVTRFLG
jgi:pimeloyl-ACP methyl ester carboxylesterase